MPFHRFAAGSIAVIALAAAGLGAGAVAPAIAIKPAAPYVQIFGPESLESEPGFHRIRDRAAWEALWARHAGAEAAAIAGLSTAPAVDFARCEVIAFFRGPATNIRGEVVEAIDDTGRERRIRFASSGYQTFSLAGDDTGVACAPYGLWIVDRTDAPIVVEENVQNIKGQPPEWRQRARLDLGD